jgi:PAS domain S-box-containing protein
LKKLWLVTSAYVVMPEKSEPDTWGLATASQIDAAFRAARIAITTQDAELRYVAAINPICGQGIDSVVGLTEEELLLDGPTRDISDCKKRVIANGDNQSLDFKLRREGEAEWYRLFVGPLLEGGKTGGVIAAAIDITELKSAEEHLRLALLELAHRSKNLLAVVLSIARQSIDDSDTLAQFSSRFMGRVRSLALAHDVLTDERWRGATLFELIRSQLSGLGEAAVQSRVEGHNAYLRPNAVQYVGLALHELVAQSMLNGALSQPDGRVSCASAMVESAGGEGLDLLLRWEETGRAQPARKDASKFGHALLEQIVPAALGGSATLSRGEQGVAYELRIPSSQYF